MITYLGGKSVAEAVPLAPLASAQLAAVIASQAARESALDAQIAAPFVPPDPTALAAALASAVSGLSAALAALPDAVVDGKIAAAAQLAALRLALTPARALVAQLGALASAGGVHLYAYEGPASALGSAVGGETSSGLPGGGGPTATARALVLVTESPAAWAALSTVLRTG